MAISTQSTLQAVACSGGCQVLGSHPPVLLPHTIPCHCGQDTGANHSTSKCSFLSSILCLPVIHMYLHSISTAVIIIACVIIPPSIVIWGCCCDPCSSSSSFLSPCLLLSHCPAWALVIPPSLPLLLVSSVIVPLLSPLLSPPPPLPLPFCCCWCRLVLILALIVPLSFPSSLSLCCYCCLAVVVVVVSTSLFSSLVSHFPSPCSLFPPHKQLLMAVVGVLWH
jgi:hypothetical protein